MSRLYVVVFVDLKSGVDEVREAIDYLGDEYVGEVVELERNNDKGKWKAKFLVTGEIVDTVADEPDEFVKALWDRIGDFCWISLNGTSDEFGEVSEKYGKPEYKEMMGE